LNKIDLVPKETAEAWLKFLRSSFESHGDNVKVVLFKASFVETPIKPGMTVYGTDKQGKLPPRTIPSAIPVGKETLLSILSAWQTEKNKSDESSLNVVFLGQPNVGKSAVINTLLGRPRLTTAGTIPVSGLAAPTTKVPAELGVKVGENEVRLIDTPGWEFNPPDVEGEDEEMDMGEEEDDEKWAILEGTVARDMLTRNLGRIDKVKDALPLGE
jgi:nuclear GTP-binding protein